MKCPDSIEELEELERMLPLCRKTLFDQAEAKIKSGTACSLHDASRQLGGETGKNPESIERAIRREQETRGGTVSPATSEKFRSNEHFRTSFTGDNEWYTPQIYIDSARKVMGEIDLDPATSEHAQSRIKAANYYTIDNSGLNYQWDGRIWLNPPYSQPIIYDFIAKLIEDLQNIKQAILLTHNYTDTAWFHLAESKAALLCFTKGRIRFENKNRNLASPTQGSTFFYYGKEKDKFMEVFTNFGFIR